MFASKYSLDKKINNPDSYNLTKDLIWCSPDGFDLTMDIYSPKRSEKPLPVIVMFHGGGFLIRRKEILNNMAQYIASNHDYVVCNVNYRLLQDQNKEVLIGIHPKSKKEILQKKGIKGRPDYLSCNKKNYSIPNDFTDKKINLEKAVEIIEKGGEQKRK